MIITQISVVLKNLPGMLADLSELLGKEGVNIRAVSVADTSEVSTVRLVVDDPAKALNILKGNGYSVYETDVLAVETPDHPGGLNAVMPESRRPGSCQYTTRLNRTWWSAFARTLEKEG